MADRPVPARWALPAVILVGVVARLVIAVVLRHDSYDLESARIVVDTLRTHPLDVYTTIRWPYPPGYFPALLVADWASRTTGTDFAVWVHLPPIIADGALAWVVHRFLVGRGASPRWALAGAALVALGPTFAIVSGYTVQIDSVAILPVALALLVWEEPSLQARRGLLAGALIGLGCLLKTVPLALVLALLPTARDLRERLRLTAVAVALPAAALIPWLVADLSAVTDALRYGGLPGVGGLSLLVQPDLGAAVIAPSLAVPVNSLNARTIEWAAPFVGVALLATGVLLYRRRVPAARGCAIVWLVFYAITPNFFPQYLVWGLPFFIMAGAVMPVAVAQAVLTIPHVLFEGRPWSEEFLGWVYVVIMIGAWAAAVVALARNLSLLRGGGMTPSRRPRGP
jgi:hypothetical protein